MVVVFHGEEGGGGAAQKGQEDEGSFGDSPFVWRALVLSAA